VGRERQKNSIKRAARRGRREKDRLEDRIERIEKRAGKGREDIGWGRSGGETTWKGMDRRRPLYLLYSTYIQPARCL
jgi:hypothetical protein